MEVRHWNPGDSLFCYNNKVNEFSIVKLQDFIDSWSNDEYRDVPVLIINDTEHTVDIDELFDHFCVVNNLIFAHTLSDLLIGMVNCGVEFDIIDPLIDFIIENKLC